MQKYFGSICIAYSIFINGCSVRRCCISFFKLWSCLNSLFDKVEQSQNGRQSLPLVPMDSLACIAVQSRVQSKRTYHEKQLNDLNSSWIHPGTLKGFDWFVFFFFFPLTLGNSGQFSSLIRCASSVQTQTNKKKRKITIKKKKHSRQIHRDSPSRCCRKDWSGTRFIYLLFQKGGREILFFFFHKSASLPPLPNLLLWKALHH